MTPCALSDVVAAAVSEEKGKAGVSKKGAIPFVKRCV